MKIQLFNSEDWCGLYVDGKLYYEDHSIPSHVWLELFKGESVWDIPTFTGQDLEIWGNHCPSTWAEIERVIKDV